MKYRMRRRKNLRIKGHEGHSRGRRNNLFFILVFALFVIFVRVTETSSQAADQRSEADCVINKGPCLKKAGDVEVSLDINPKPIRAMKELSFSIRFNPVQRPLPEKINIDLAMPGMFMGINTVSLGRQAQGLYSGTGIIPRCSSVKRLWKATVQLPGGGKVDFFFDVVY